MKKITPHLFVNDVQENISYYEKILGFKVDYVQSDGGKPNFAMLVNGNVELMIGLKKALYKYLPEFENKELASSTVFYIEMTNVESYYEEIREDVKIVKELQETWYKTKEFWIKDCNGYLLAFFENV